VPTRARITGIGSYVPERVVTNDELSQWMDTSDEWIIQRTGISERHWVAPDQAPSDLGLAAATVALEDAGVAAEDLDMVLFATIASDHFFPGAACYLQAKMEIPGIPAIDVRQQCSGFVYALSMADQFIRSGFAKRLLVVGAEIHSKGLDISTEGRDLAVLFGDGAGAVVVEAAEVDGPDSGAQVLSSHLHADGRFAEELWLPGPGMAYERFMDQGMLDDKVHYPAMNGRAVYVNAVKRMGEAVTEALEANDASIDDVDLFFFHQANLRINEAVGSKMGIPPEKIFNTIQRFGNTTAATIPLGMHEAVKAGVLQEGMLVCLAAFGSGFTWGSALLRW